MIITTSLETLIGLSNEPGLIGDTIVPATLIRHWATNPDWASLAVLDHNGLISSVSHKKRFPGTQLRRTVQARWQHCTYPGCAQPASAAQIDHAVPHALGGHTDLENLHPLCPRHHRLKEQPGVHVRLNPDGSATWTLPSRRNVNVPAPDHRSPPGPYDGWDDDCSCDSSDDRDPPEIWDADPGYETRVARLMEADGLFDAA